MSKNNYDNLYVGSEIKIAVHYKPGRQYDVPYYAFIVWVSRKRRLFYSALDENGEMCFYDYKTRQKVKELVYESSMIVEILDIGVPKFERLEDGVGYFIPFDEYMQSKNYEWYKKYKGKMTPALANAILKYTNHFENGYVKLSPWSKQSAYRDLSEGIGYDLEKIENKSKK